MYEAWRDGEDVLTKAPVSGVTLADSISAGLPRDRIKALAAVKETNGAYICVSDEEILASVPALARATGVFAEPAGAAAHTGLLKAIELGYVSASDRIVILNTGSGLKDIVGAMKGVDLVGTKANYVEPDLADLKRVMANL
jgi:threonine synthase